MKNESKDELKYKAYRFSIKLIKFVSTLPQQRIYWIIADQLVRAGTSIGANIKVNKFLVLNFNFSLLVISF